MSFSAKMLFGKLQGRPATVTDFMAVWDFVDGVAEHFDPSKQAALEAFFSDVLKSVSQVQEYVKLVPARAEQSVREHNRRLAEIVDGEWRNLGLKDCHHCGLLFVPDRPRVNFCSGCWEMMQEMDAVEEDEP